MSDSREENGTPIEQDSLAQTQAEIGAPESERRPKRKFVGPVAKSIMAVIVCIGLFFAGKSAVQRWQEQTRTIQSEIDRLSEQIQGESDDRIRADLLEQQSRLERSLPALRNLDWAKISWSFVIYAAALIPPGFVLREAVCSLGQRPNLSTAMASQLLGHVGKYVPGKAMVIVLRATGLAIDGVDIVVSTVSVFMETLLMMAVGAAVAGLVICWLPVEKWMIVTAATVAVCASVPTLPPILKFVAARIAKRRSLDEVGHDSKSSTYFFFVGWAWSLLSWILIGTSFTMLVAAIPSPDPLPSPLLLWGRSTAAVSLGMVVGFASLLPGGAGVRELVLTMLLAPMVGPAHALLAAIAARVMFIIVESAMAGLAWGWLRRLRKIAESEMANEESEAANADFDVQSGNTTPRDQ